MKKKLLVKQRDVFDCGVCSMLSIIRYYNGNISLEKLRELTHTDVSGTTAFNIVFAFQKIGFDSYAIKVKDIKKENLKYPFIAHVILNNSYYHFLTVYEIKDDKVLIMDPSKGFISLSMKEFLDIFTGNIIISFPKDKQIVNEDDVKISSIIINLIKKEKGIIVKLIVLSILFTFITIISSYAFKIFSNNLNNYLNLIILILIFLILTIMKVLTLYTRNYYQNYLNLRIDNEMINNFVNHIFYLPLKNVKSRTTGEIMTRVKEVDLIKDLFSNIFLLLFFELFLALVSLIILFLINSNLTWILIITLFIYLLFSICVNKNIYRKIMININYETEFNSKLTEYLNMFNSIKNLNLTSSFLKRIENSISLYNYDLFKFNNYFNHLDAFKNFLLETSLLLINAYGFILIINNKLNLIDLVTFNLLINYTIYPIKNFVEILPKFNYIKACFVKLAEFLSIKKEALLPADNNTLNGKITFDNVNYSYNDYNYILKNLSFKINAGDKVFLKGTSGSGKSTICNLLYKNISDFEGIITIDNKNIKDLNLNVIRNNILYISQDELLFNGTIEENILLDRSVNQAFYDDICDICCLEEIINDKEARYQALIDPDSKNFSGGEKQRMILARGLLKNGNIIIIDEALSEVDYYLEEKIINKILNYFKDRTIIYISHKKQEKLFDYTINLKVSYE